MLPRILKGQRGFTLIELLAVIAILTVLAGTVAGAITGVGPAARRPGWKGTGTPSFWLDRFGNV